MQQFLDQAAHNQRFHDAIDAIGQFHDWKITVVFYTAIHYLKALAASRGIDIGETHAEINKSVNPDSPNAKMQIKRNAWRAYQSLLNYSREARYEGVSDLATFQALKKADHALCLIHLDNFKKYIEGQGITI